jgi:hypothetical protein
MGKCHGNYTNVLLFGLWEPSTQNQKAQNEFLESGLGPMKKYNMNLF